MTAVRATALGGSAVSDIASKVQEQAQSALSVYEQSQALFGPRSEARSQLLKLANENRSEIDFLAVFRAGQFIRALPYGIPMPEFSVEPDGSVSVDWTVKKSRALVLSIDAGNRIAYAWINDGDRGQAVAYFDGNVVPDLILRTAESILEQ